MFFFHLTMLPQIPTVGIASCFAARARNLQLLSNPLAKQWHICILHPQRELVYSALYFQLPSSLATSLCTYVWHAPLPVTVNRKGGVQGSPTDKSKDLGVLTRAGWPTKIVAWSCVDDIWPNPLPPEKLTWNGKSRGMEDDVPFQSSDFWVPC